MRYFVGTISFLAVVTNIWCKICHTYRLTLYTCSFAKAAKIAIALHKYTMKCLLTYLGCRCSIQCNDDVFTTNYSSSRWRSVYNIRRRPWLVMVHILMPCFIISKSIYRYQIASFNIEHFDVHSKCYKCHFENLNEQNGGQKLSLKAKYPKC